MKKIILFLTAVLMLNALPANAGKDKHINFSRLPAASQQFVTQHFTEVPISLVTMDRELLDTTYEVIFSDGRKVEFGKDGSWKEIDCKYGRVPLSAVPERITEFINSRHAEFYVVEIDRDKRDCEVKLNNGMELVFDLSYNFLGYDH